MLWVFYTLLAAMFWAIVNIVDKFTMSKLVDNPIVPLLVLAVVGLLSAVVIYPIYGFSKFTVSHLLLAFFAGGCYFLAMIFYFLALRHDEVSKVIPIFYLAPVFILFLARVMLHESLTFNEYFGIILMVMGAILISASTSLSFRTSKGIGYMLIAAFCYALNQVFTKYLLEYNDFLSVFAYIRIGIFLALLPFLLFNFTKIISYCKTISYRAYKIMSLNQVLNLMGVFTITLAMTSGYVTLVNALSSIQPFFVLVLSLSLSFFVPSMLKESFEPAVLIKKVIATALIVAGVLLI